MTPKQFNQQTRTIENYPYKNVEPVGKSIPVLPDDDYQKLWLERDTDDDVMRGVKKLYNANVKAKTETFEPTKYYCENCEFEFANCGKCPECGLEITPF